MFEPQSRYYTIETATHVGEDGRVVAYKRRRFLPRVDDLAVVAEVALSQGDRLDLLAARMLGDPEQFWRLCDANAPLNPFDLAADPGRMVRMAALQLPAR